MADNLVPITIDGHQLEVPRGTLVVEAARQIGVEIPVYCYHPKMKPVGACRVCMVEVENQRAPVMAACTTEVMPNMVVHTRSDKAVAAREGVLEFLLINHPLDCPVCDRGGECDLQDFVLRYGPSTTRFVEQKRHFEKSKQVGRNVLLDRERCIMCQRCVRFCSEIAMEEGLVIVDRGNRSEIGTFAGRSFDSQYSGNTIELCPVGALTAKSYRFNARPWEQQHFAGLCNHCSVGCNITVDVRFDEVVRFRSRCNDEIDDGWLCDQGRYGFDHIHADDRLETPLMRNGSGELEPVTWEKVLTEVAAKLSDESAISSILLGSQLSLEDGHAWLRIARGLVKKGNLAHASAHEALTGGDSEATARIAGCDDAEVIVCVGSHPHATHAGADLRIKKGLRRGARLVSLNSSPLMEGLADFIAVGQPSALWEKLLSSIDSMPEAEAGGLRIPAPRPWEAGGSSSADWDKLVEVFRDKTKVLVIATGDLSAQGLEKLPEAIKARGWATAPHGLLHLRSGANAVGLDQVGFLPAMGPGGAKLDGVKTYGQSWGQFSSRSGQGYRETAQAGSGVIFAVGCDPLSLEGAKKPSFLVACATAPNATTEQADIVLPMSTWVESHGVFVSTDGTIQLSRQAVMPVGKSQPAWAIASAIWKFAKGGEAPYKTTRQVFSEIGELNPAFSGLSYANFESQGEMHWSYPQQADLGMPRPDLSAIPVPQVDTPMWMPLANTGSKVEGASRISRGDRPPSVPGQDDPRRIAAMLGLAYDYDRHTEEPKVEDPPSKAGYIPLRVMATSSAQPAGPTPAKRHQKLGVGAHVAVLVPAPPALPEPVEPEVAPVAEEAKVEEQKPPAVPDTQESTAEKKEGQGDSNVATVDVVTEQDASQSDEADKVESSQAKVADGTDSEAGVTEKGDEPGDQAEADAKTLEPAAESEPAAEPSVTEAPVEAASETSKKSSGQKPKKSRGKGSKEKKK